MPEYILGMEPESVAKQMIRNYRATMGPEILTRDLDDRDCLTLMLEFNRHLVELNEVLQRQVLDKLGTTLPAPILAASGPSLREKESEWISVEEKLPREMEFVLVFRTRSLPQQRISQFFEERFHNF